MYKQCTTEQAAVRQRQLERGLLAAMEKRSYDEITVSDLCAEMGVPRKSFYRYFSGKEGALHALIDHTLQDFEMQYVPSVLAEEYSFSSVVYCYFQFWQQQKRLLDALSRSGLSGVLIERAINYAVENAMNSDRLGLYEQRSLKNEAVIFVICGMMSMVIRWHKDGYSRDVDSMAKMAAKLLTQPLYRGNL